MNRTIINDKDAQDYLDGYQRGYKEKLAEQAQEAAGQEKQSEQARSAMARAIINLINAIMRLIGIPLRFLGGAWRPASPQKVARDAVASESALVAPDQPREVLRVARRIQLGASIDQARLSEPVLGALMTMGKAELVQVIQSDMDTIGRWAAVQQGVAGPDQDDHDRAAAAARYEHMYWETRKTADDYREVGALMPAR